MESFAFAIYGLIASMKNIPKDYFLVMMVNIFDINLFSVQYNTGSLKKFIILIK
jgi:hypothetical protein